MTGKKATDQWYAESKHFDFQNKCFSPKTGCFSQVVWKESIEIGAGVAISEQGQHFCVVRYKVAGNVKGEYSQNIGDKLETPQDKIDMDNLRIKVGPFISNKRAID